MSQNHVARTIANARWVHDYTVKITEGWPEDKVTFQTAPTDCHLLWTLGHLAVASEWFRSLMVPGPTTLPASYSGLFAPGSKPSPSASAYPPIAEVRAAFNASFEAFISAAQHMTESEAFMPCVGDSHGLASNRIEVIDRNAWHEGWHSGQLSSLRKALGLPGIMG